MKRHGQYFLDFFKGTISIKLQRLSVRASRKVDNKRARINQKRGVNVVESSNKVDEMSFSENEKMKEKVDRNLPKFALNRLPK